MQTVTNACLAFSQQHPFSRAGQGHAATAGPNAARPARSGRRSALRSEWQHWTTISQRSTSLDLGPGGCMGGRGRSDGSRSSPWLQFARRARSAGCARIARHEKQWEQKERNRGVRGWLRSLRSCGCGGVWRCKCVRQSSHVLPGRRSSPPLTRSHHARITRIARIDDQSLLGRSDPPSSLLN